MENQKPAYNPSEYSNISEERLIELQNQILKLLGLEELPFLMRKRQIQAIIAFINEQDVACFLPTGYGKTLIAILSAIYIYRSTGKKTIYIGLLKSLTSEMQQTFTTWVKKVDSDLEVIIDDGDHNTNIDHYQEINWLIATMTPEKFDSVISNDSKREVLMENVGLVINDEVHSLGDPSRGHVYENYLISVKEAFPEARHVYLSATVGNPDNFASWLDAELIIAPPEERPVPLQISIMQYQEIMLSWNNELPDFKANYELRLNMLRELVNQYPEDYWLIFVTSRPRAKQIAVELAGLKGNVDLETLVEEHGIAYHHGGLEPEEKTYVENAFRSRQINIVVATPTLAVGVNTSAKRVVIFDVEQYSALEGSVPIDANRIGQTLGRGGRPEVKCPNCSGKVIANVCMKCNWMNYGFAYVFTPIRLNEVISDRVYNPMVVSSALKPRLHEKILRWIGGGLATDLLDVVEMCSRSYANISEEEAINAINWLEAFGFIKTTDDGYAITYVGKMTVRMYVKPETVVSWQSQICNVQDPTNMNEIFIRFGFVPEYTEIITVRAEDEQVIGYGQQELGVFFPTMKKHCDNRMCLTCQHSLECADKAYKIESCENWECNIPDQISNALLKCYFLTFYDDLKKKYLPKKKAKVNGRWVETDELKELVISNGDRMILKKAGSRMFNAASVIFSGNKAISSSLKTISLMCEAGTLKKELIDLCKMKGIGFARAQKLYDAGIKTQGEFLATTTMKLAKVMGMSERQVKGIIAKNTNVEPEEDE